MTSLYREPEESPGVEVSALECVDVFKLFGSGSVETVALRGLDLRVERGEHVAVLGRSGSGKSTFVRLAAGLDDASAGEVRAFGRPLGRMSADELARYRARTVAVVLQSDNLWSALTAREIEIRSKARPRRLGWAGRGRIDEKLDSAISGFSAGALRPSL